MRDRLEDVESFARLCAQLAAPFADREEVLRAAQVPAATFNAARTRWEAELRQSPGLRDAFRVAFSEERLRVLGAHRAERAAASAVTAAPPLAALPVAPPPPPPSPIADETVFAPRPQIREPLPFREGTFSPQASPVPPRPAPAPFDPDGTLPIASPVAAEPTLPFVKMLPSHSHKKTPK